MTEPREPAPSAEKLRELERLEMLLPRFSAAFLEGLADTLEESTEQWAEEPSRLRFVGLPEATPA